jgi:hypothetical protein
MSERFVVQAASGEFSVIEGVKLNCELLSRAAADLLAHEPKAASAANVAKPATNVAPGNGGENFPSRGESFPPKPKPTPPSAETREQAMLRRAAADDEAMTRANAKPIPAAVFEVERWASRGGSAGFSCNGILLSGRKPK